MKKCLSLYVSIFLLSLIFGACQTKNYSEKLESLYKHTVPLISPKVLADEINQKKSMVLLDTRSPEEYAVSRIPGARFIDYENFEVEEIAHIPKDAAVVLYCSVGYRSEKIGEQLLEKGYTDVKNLYGGIFQWKNDGFEVVNKEGIPSDSVHTYNKSWSVWLTNGVKVY